MKLLIITQTVDREHPILGFFHRWIEEFSKHFEHIHVIALQAGEYDLPQNVTVHSLGKEQKHTNTNATTDTMIYHSKTTMINHSGFGERVAYVGRFLRLAWRLRRQYDAVFVHMNPEYIVLAGWFWRLTGKKIGLWYNHTVGSFWLKVAQPFTNIVFHTSPYAYTARYNTAQRMPAGIDTDVFKPYPEVKKIPKSIYFQGRITPAKRVHVLLEAFAELYEKGEASLLTIVGPEDEKYTKPLREQYALLIARGAIIFKGPMLNTETPILYAVHSVSVNLTDKGNYDKTVLESLACGTPCVVASDAFKDFITSSLVLNQPSREELESTLHRVLNRDGGGLYEEMYGIHEKVVCQESLAVLGSSLYTVYATLHGS